MGWTFSGDWEGRPFIETPRSLRGLKGLHRLRRGNQSTSTLCIFHFILQFIKQVKSAKSSLLHWGNMFTCVEEVAGTEVTRDCGLREANRRAVF